MAFLNSIDKKKIQIKPNFLKRIMFNDPNNDINDTDFEIMEKYDFEFDTSLNSYKWFDNEFNLDIEQGLENIKINFEYTSLILTVTRINKFFKSKKRNMISVLSSDFNSTSTEVISKNMFYYLLGEGSDLTFLYLKRNKEYFEHHIIFSASDQNNFFDFKLYCKKKDILDFYKNLIKEINDYREEILPGMIKNMSSFYKDYLEKIDFIDYEDIKNISDDHFQLTNIDIENSIQNHDCSQELREYIDHIKYLKSEEKNLYDENLEEESDNSVEMEFYIEDMENLENEFKEIYNEVEKDFINDTYKSSNLLAEIEEEFMELMDQIIFEDLDPSELKLIINEIKTIIDSVKYTMEDNIKDKVDFEKKILLDSINAYGIKKIKEKKEYIKEILEYINLDIDVDKLYLKSEDKKINDYKLWYKEIFKKYGKSLKNAKKNR